MSGIIQRFLRRVSIEQSNSEFYQKLLEEGKVPAKPDMESFLNRLKEGRHEPCEGDAELITRFEMQQYCPDILITNYSMLEYMLFRPIESQIWENTRSWLETSVENKLLFIIDEAHMYRGAAGGEVALLLRRMFNRLGIDRDKVQFILTTASMPDSSESDKAAVMQFAHDLTSQKTLNAFRYLTGERKVCDDQYKYEISSAHFFAFQASEFEDNASAIDALNRFWCRFRDGAEFEKLEDACAWLYDHILDYKCFSMLISKCRGTAVSLHELSKFLFPETSSSDALEALGVMLSIASLARNDAGVFLFPVRMHMLFRGMKGIFACANSECPCAHQDGGLKLGYICVSDDNMTCPHCDSAVYELYNDRRCGALFFKAYVTEDEFDQKFAYLWRHPIHSNEVQMKEIHLYIPPADFHLSKTRSKSQILPCYLDIQSGFLYMKDDAWASRSDVRKLYYTSSNDDNSTLQHEITFSKCPHCNSQLSSMKLTSFATKGNLAFYNLIKTQFEEQPAIAGKDLDPKRLPNAGRKVLLFSDSRQRAAKLARDMSDASDMTAVRQIFMLAIDEMMKFPSEDNTLDDIYDFFCVETVKKNLQLFAGGDEKFKEDCTKVWKTYERCQKRNRPFKAEHNMGDASDSVKLHLLRMFCGAYNTLYDSATCWLEPKDDCLYDALDDFEKEGIEVSKDVFLEMFNAWILSICDSSLALGNTISDNIRDDVRHCFHGYGLNKDWVFEQTICSLKGWKKDSIDAQIWINIFNDHFLISNQSGNYYVKLNTIKPCFDEKHEWFRCHKCSKITPYKLENHCPCCGDLSISTLNEIDRKALEYWSAPIKDAKDGSMIRVIDTEEHTAQLSHKDQRNELWSKSETYELRFQDLIQDDEKPVDILSCTTTMEVGIDIGSLVAVGLRNIPPMRENYQQRAGRAGRRGTSLSTIVTFCENGPHDTLYFHNPEPMFRGDPRRPWIDVNSAKLHYRHLAMLLINQYLENSDESMDSLQACQFIDNKLDGFVSKLDNIDLGKFDSYSSLLIDKHEFIDWLRGAFTHLKKKRLEHPELYGDIGDKSGYGLSGKSLLDALYEEGIIPTYSFPKNVVSMNIADGNNIQKFQIERGLDIAITEYAPRRSIVVDKKTYQVGGLYYPGSEKKKGNNGNAARAFIDDPNYHKEIKVCRKCGWFGLASEDYDSCPFCQNSELQNSLPMLIPWGFAPKNGAEIKESKLVEQPSFSELPLYSTVSPAENLHQILNYQYIRMANRKNQRIIAMNKGIAGSGFDVCKDCGAALPHHGCEKIKNIERPYRSKFGKKCKHIETENVYIGYDFLTDMLVLEFELDDSQILVENHKDNLWLSRAAQSFAEALRLSISKKLDIEFSELLTGYRVRHYRHQHWIDIYIYDSLSSGAGYAVGLEAQIPELLDYIEEMLMVCQCDSACYDCLKHYRNQITHGMLDRIAALQLLMWGKNGALPKFLSSDEAIKLIKSIGNILNYLEISIMETNGAIFLTHSDITKKVVVYPAMLLKPVDDDTIYIQDAELKYAKPRAVKIIRDAFGVD